MWLIAAMADQTFLLGIKMRLVPKLNEVTNPETCAKVMQLQALQEQSLALTETRRIHKGNLDNNHNMHQVYDILQAMTISSWQAHKPAQPLFHAISPMATKEGYLVRYLPQYCHKVQAAIAALVNCSPAGLASSIVTTPSLIRQIKPDTSIASMHHILKLLMNYSGCIREQHTASFFIVVKFF